MFEWVAANPVLGAISIVVGLSPPVLYLASRMRVTTRGRRLRCYVEEVKKSKPGTDLDWRFQHLTDEPDDSDRTMDGFKTDIQDARGPRLVLLEGDALSGRTTALRDLACRLANESDNYVPVVLSLQAHDPRSTSFPKVFEGSTGDGMYDGALKLPNYDVLRGIGKGESAERLFLLIDDADAWRSQFADLKSLGTTIVAVTPDTAKSAGKLPSSHYRILPFTEESVAPLVESLGAELARLPILIRDLLTRPFFCGRMREYGRLDEALHVNALSSYLLAQFNVGPSELIAVATAELQNTASESRAPAWRPHMRVYALCQWALQDSPEPPAVSELDPEESAAAIWLLRLFPDQQVALLKLLNAESYTLSADVVSQMFLEDVDWWATLAIYASVAEKRWDTHGDVRNRAEAIVSGIPHQEFADIREASDRTELGHTITEIRKRHSSNAPRWFCDWQRVFDMAESDADPVAALGFLNSSDSLVGWAAASAMRRASSQLNKDSEAARELQRLAYEAATQQVHRRVYWVLGAVPVDHSWVDEVIVHGLEASDEVVVRQADKARMERAGIAVTEVRPTQRHVGQVIPASVEFVRQTPQRRWYGFVRDKEGGQGQYWFGEDQVGRDDLRIEDLVPGELVKVRILQLPTDRAGRLDVLVKPETELSPRSAPEAPAPGQTVDATVDHVGRAANGLRFGYVKADATGKSYWFGEAAVGGGLRIQELRKGTEVSVRIQSEDSQRKPGVGVVDSVVARKATKPGVEAATLAQAVAAASMTAAPEAPAPRQTVDATVDHVGRAADASEPATDRSVRSRVPDSHPGWQLNQPLGLWLELGLLGPGDVLVRKSPAGGRVPLVEVEVCEDGRVLVPGAQYSSSDLSVAAKRVSGKKGRQRLSAWHKGDMGGPTLQQIRDEYNES